MVLDSSALLAILFGEPEADRLKRAMADSGHFRMSAVNWLEAMMVLGSRRGVNSTAVLAGEPLLFKGDEFSRTGVPAIEW